MASKQAQRKCDAFNKAHPVGSTVRYWKGAREGEGNLGETRSEAHVLGEHTAVVWISGVAGCIALTHVEPVVEPKGGA